MAAVSISALNAYAFPALAQTAPAQRVDIAPQALDQALVEIGRRYGVTVIAAEALTRGLTAPRVSGDLTANQALARALRGSGLAANRSANGGFVIARQVRRTETQTEDDIVVTGQRRNYATENSSAATRTDLDQQENPTTVSVVSSQYLEDRNPIDFRDALRAVPGVSLESLLLLWLGRQCARDYAR